jgi:hypothetical protein
LSLPVSGERLRREFPALTDEDLAAYEAVTRRLLGDQRRRGQLLAELMSAAQQARAKQAAGAGLDEAERLAVAYVEALRKMQRGPARG